MNPFDLLVIVVIALSGLFAFARGFVKEALSVGAWIAAGLASLYAFPYLRPLAEKLLPKGMIADVGTCAAVFVVVLILLSLLTSAISHKVKASPLSALDRTLGLLFGLLRGAIIACLLYIGVTWALPEANRPAWIKEARTAPLLGSGADALKALVPPSVRNRAETAASQAHQKVEQIHEAEGAMRALETPYAAHTKPADSAANKGYTQDQQRDMNRLIQQNTQ